MKLNHVEMTVPRGTITDEWCSSLDTMLTGIFGWTGKTQQMVHPMTGADVKARFYDISDDQFLGVNEHENHVNPGEDDHVGFYVDSEEEMRDLLAKCLLLASNDRRVEFMHVSNGEPTLLEGEETVTAGFYVKFLLPTFFDIQTKWIRELS